MTGRCRTCRRALATPADWQAFTVTSTCNDDRCVWGGDRCWSDGDCGVPADAVAGLVDAARCLRGRRGWKDVPHRVAVIAAEG